MQTSHWKPAANYLLVAVPERFEQHHQPGKPRLFLPSGSDDYEALDAQIRLGVGVEIETDEVLVPVRQGLVLGVPDRLTDDMILCAGPHSKMVPHEEAVIVGGKTIPDLATGGRKLRSTGKLVEQNIPRTAADIMRQIRLGDTIHFDDAVLTDEAEVEPGIYLIGYVDVIARIWFYTNTRGQPGRWPEPIAGYVLLKRVRAKQHSEIATEIEPHVLPDEGIVAFHSSPLRGTRQEVQIGDHVIVDVRHTRVETIAGCEYIAVRQDYILAIRTNG